VLRGLSLGPGLPCRIVVLEDLSGSMSSIAPAREVVLAELLDWLGRNLQAADEISVMSFAGDACVRLPPTPVDTRLRLSLPRLTSYTTMLAPAWALVGAMPRFEPSDAQGVRMPDRSVSVLISDGMVADLQGRGGEAGARESGLDAEALLLPIEGDVEDRKAPPCWTAAFPDSTTYAVDAADSAALALDLARAISGLTGRSLQGSALQTPEPAGSVAG
jgi:hypothetical protein